MSRSQLLMNYNAEKNRQEQMQPAQTPGPVVILWKVSSKALRLAQCLSLLDNDPSGFQVYATEIQHKYQKTTPFTQTLIGESVEAKNIFGSSSFPWQVISEPKYT